MKKGKNKKKVLIVEDNATLRDMLHAWLSDILPECEFVRCVDAESGLKKLLWYSPEIAIVDIRLPGMDGIELTRRIKTFMPFTKVIVLTIYEASNYRDDAFSAGASFFMSKREMASQLPFVLKNIIQ